MLTTLDVCPPTGRPRPSASLATVQGGPLSPFKPEPVPDDVLQAILELTAQTLSGYNLHPCSFIALCNGENNQRLQKAALGLEEDGEATVVAIAVGLTENCKEGERLQEGGRRGAETQAVPVSVARAEELPASFPMPVWVNRHAMVAVNTLTLAAATYGFDAAPMAGLPAEAVKEELGVPDNSHVVAMLIGRMR